VNALVEDVEGAVEALMEVDAATGVADPLAVGRDVDDQRAQPDGVVVGDVALVLEAEDVVERPSRGPGQPGGGGIGRGNGEAAVVPGEVTLEDHTGLLLGGGTGEPELAGEAVLERAPEALHPTLGLG
jgi:hypothetical protein